MARNVKPLTSRLTIKDYWYSRDLPLNETPCLDNLVGSFSKHNSFKSTQQSPKGKWEFNQGGYQGNGHYSKGSNEVLRYLFINNLIWGCFLKLGILTSDVRLSKTCLGDTTIYFLYHPLRLCQSSSKKRTLASHTGGFSNKRLRVRRHTFKNTVPYLLEILKLIINLKYPLLNIKFVCVKAAHSLVDPKILNHIIQFSVAKNPKFFKPVLLQYLRIYKKLARRRLLTKGGSFSGFAKKTSTSPFAPSQRGESRVVSY